MSIEISPKSFFEQPSVADMRLIACPGAEELTGLIDKHLVRWAKAAGIEKDTFIISCDCPRFQSGDAKGLVKESVRGDDIFIVVDPGNYSVTYKLFNYENHMSPDDHFANLKRLIQAVAGKAHRVSVIMPSLYGGRQHRRVVRESLDCAVALQELQTMGVRNIITFDAHDPRVQNAVPLMSFDNAMPTYQVLKSLLKKDPTLSFDKEKFTVVSPDEGAMNRNMYFSSVLGCNLGMFYKRRDYTRVVNGRNPIVAHEYLGESVEGKTVFIADDIIASGESMLEVASNLKERGAANIIANATFPLFTSGLEKFDIRCGHQPDLPYARAADPRLVCGRGRFQVRCLLCGGAEPRYVRFQHHRPPEEDREPAGKPQVRSCSKAPAPCVQGLFEFS